MMRKGIIIITAFLVLLLCACSEKPTILYDMDWYSAEALGEVISFMVPEGYEDTGVWTETEDGKRLEQIFRNEDGTEIGIGIAGYEGEQVLDMVNGIDVLDYLPGDDISLEEYLMDEDFVEGYPNIYKTLTSAAGDTCYLSRAVPRTAEYYESEDYDKENGSLKLLEAVTEHGPYVVYFNIWNPERDLTPNEDQCFENMLYGVRFKD